MASFSFIVFFIFILFTKQTTMSTFLFVLIVNSLLLGSALFVVFSKFELFYMSGNTIIWPWHSKIKVQLVVFNGSYAHLMAKKYMLQSVWYVSIKELDF